MNSIIDEREMDQSIEEFLQKCARFSMLPKAECKMMGKSIIYASGINNPAFNGVFEILDDQSSIAENKAIAFFQSKQLPFIWWTRNKILSDSFCFAGCFQGVILDLSQENLYKLTTADDLEIRETNDKNDPCFSKIALMADEKENMDLIQEFSLFNQSQRNNGAQLHYIAYLERCPVATATISFETNMIGIWGLSTVPECRKRGIATSLVHNGIMEAKKRGYGKIMALLDPQGMAWTIFKKFGFKEANKFPFYIFQNSEINS